MPCTDCEWRDRYIEELLATLECVKEVLAEVPEAWPQLEHAGVNFMVSSQYQASS